MPPPGSGRDTATEILGSILIVGFTQEFLVYAAVRFSIYYSSEFDQRVDGVIYGTAAGIGYAAYLNIATVAASGGISGAELSAGAIRTVGDHGWHKAPWVAWWAISWPAPNLTTNRYGGCPRRPYAGGGH